MKTIAKSNSISEKLFTPLIALGFNGDRIPTNFVFFSGKNNTHTYEVRITKHNEICVKSTDKRI